MGWLLAGLLSISAYILLLDRAQPETGVPLTVTRTEALDQAETFLQSRGYDLADMERTAGFRSDSASKQYLEKHLDPALAQHIMAEESPIFYWFCRWYRPMEKEAFYVWLGTEGRVWGFHRTLSDDTPASAELDGDAEHIARMELASFESAEASCRLVSEYKESLPGRTDDAQHRRSADRRRATSWRSGYQVPRQACSAASRTVRSRAIRRRASNITKRTISSSSRLSFRGGLANFDSMAGHPGQRK